MPTRTSSPTDTQLITLGCRLNTYESEVMRNLIHDSELGKTVVINTCAVTAEAVRQARQTIRRAHRDNPDVPIIVTGCAAQIDPEMFANMPEVTRVVGNHEKLQADTWSPDLLRGESKIKVNDIMAVKETAAHLIDGMEGRARAYIQIQNGCDHRCTFCIIPYGRGNARSVPAGDVVAMVKRLVETGHYEVVLTGVDLTSWGQDLPGQPPLGNLVQRILKLVPDLPQLRISSIDAIEIDEVLFDAMSDRRVAPFMHLSLQHGDDLILKRMKRRHSRSQAVDLANRLREARPEIALGADLIAGFPTETEDAFQRSMDLVAECHIAFLHVFPYSSRPGTPASRMPQLDARTIKSRAARLREVGAVASCRHLETHVGSTTNALIERNNRARLADFSPVEVQSQTPIADGKTIQVRITGHDGQKLFGARV
ncbi:MAG: tRNA (N(6)-L-threonylcarbamoyladenosine(37)-C(2))-methylthiotransferase MtaB [Pseudomonadota bacterium]